MSDHGSEADATEEINVDDSDSRSCDSPPRRESPGQTTPMTPSAAMTPRSHPFSISRLLASSAAADKGSSSETELDGGSSQRNWADWDNDGKSSGKDDDDDAASTADAQAAASLQAAAAAAAAGQQASLQAAAADLLAPFRLFPGLYANGVIRVPAHRPPGSQGALLPPWALQPLQQQSHQQQAAAAGLHTARFLANLAAHPLQAHPHLKDRLAGEFGANNP